MARQMQVPVALLLYGLLTATGIPLVSIATTTRLAIPQANGLNTLSQNSNTPTPKNTLLLSTTGSLFSSLENSRTILKSGPTSTLLSSTASRSSGAAMTSKLSASTPRTIPFSTPTPTYSTTTQRTSGNIIFPTSTSKTSMFSTPAPKTSTVSTSNSKTKTFDTSTKQTLISNPLPPGKSIISVTTTAGSKLSASTFSTSNTKTSIFSTATTHVSTLPASNPNKSTFYTSTPKIPSIYSSNPKTLTINTSTPVISIFSTSATTSPTFSPAKTSTYKLFDTNSTSSTPTLTTSKEIFTSKMSASSTTSNPKTGEPSITTIMNTETSSTLSTVLRTSESFQANTNFQDPNTTTLTSSTQLAITKLDFGVVSGQNNLVQDNDSTKSTSLYMDTVSKMSDWSIDKDFSIFPLLLPVRAPAVQGPSEDLSAISKSDRRSNDASLITSTTPEFQSADTLLRTPKPQGSYSTPATKISSLSFTSLSSFLGSSTTPPHPLSSNSIAQSRATTDAKSIRQQYPIMPISLLLPPGYMNALKNVASTTTSKTVSSTLSSLISSSSSEDYGNNTNNASDLLVKFNNSKVADEHLSALNETSNNLVSSNKTDVNLTASIAITGSPQSEYETTFINRPNVKTLAPDDTKLIQEPAVQNEIVNVTSSLLPYPVTTSSVQMKSTRSLPTTQRLNEDTLNAVDVNREFPPVIPWKESLDISDTTQTNSPTSSVSSESEDKNSLFKWEQYTPATVDDIKGKLNIILPVTRFQPLVENTVIPVIDVAKPTDAQNTTVIPVIDLAKTTDAQNTTVIPVIDVAKQADAHKTTVIPVIDVAKPTDAQKASTSLFLTDDIFPLVTKPTFTELGGFQTENHSADWDKETISGEATASSTLEIFDSEITLNEKEIRSSIIRSTHYAIKNTPGQFPEKATESYVTDSSTKSPATETTPYGLKYSPDETKTSVKQTISSSSTSTTTSSTNSSTTTSSTNSSANGPTISSVNRNTKHTTAFATSRIAKTSSPQDEDGSSKPPTDYYFYDASKGEKLEGNLLMFTIGWIFLSNASLI